MTGIKRNLVDKIEELLKIFPIVTLLGARQTGKTTLSKMLRPDWHYIDLEKPSDHDIVSNDPEFFLSRHAEHVIIDEAQELPLLFNVLRGVIDADRQKKGRYIITGSSSPELLKHISESLAGRVAIVEIDTLKINEIENQSLSNFYKIFQTKLSKKNLPEGQGPLTREQVHKAWLHGGYPEPLQLGSEFAYQQWMENYRSTYINRDIAKLFPRMNRRAYQHFLTILCKLSGTILNKAELARDIEVSETTIKDYLNIVEGTYLWRSLLSYNKNIKKSVIKMPTGHIRDTGLLHYLLGISDIESLYADPIVGRSFQGFVIEEIIKGLHATPVTNWQAYYYRTKNAAEIDLILDGPFGILPIEIKYGSTVKLQQLRTLQQFVKEHQLPFGLVVNQAEQADWLTPEIYQLPVAWL